MLIAKKIEEDTYRNIFRRV